MDYNYLSKEERKEMKKIIKYGEEASKTLKDFTNQINKCTDKNFAILKSLDKKQN